ncbi:hypothetical protein QBC36DRAFT_196410 [Triangularia setosa]|uniref:Uncharacterized protein n=1 Tax=Triangularia setosa TaxID=2587417 RepID=A0AAN6VZV8_9PEZI|nr:hypothetical protein QBC36DRAFT_196410 [Podospora setosa]
MVQTRSRVAASRNNITVEASSSDSDSDESIPAQLPPPRPSSLKIPATLRPRNAPLVQLNSGPSKKKRHASAALETPARKRARPHVPTDPEDADEIDEAAMEAINAFTNRQTPKHKPSGIEVLLRSSGRSSRRRLDGTDIKEIVEETPESKITRRPAPVIEDSEPEEDKVAGEDDGIENGEQYVDREDGSPELDSSPPKPKQPDRGRRFASRMLQPAPTALTAPLRPATINNLRPPTGSDGGIQRPILDRSVLPSVEADVPGYQGNVNLSDAEEEEGSDGPDGENRHEEEAEEVGALEVMEQDAIQADAEDAYEDENDTALHPSIKIQVPEVVDKRLIVTLESEHLNTMRDIMGKEQWSGLGRFWELQIYGADGFLFGSESPPATTPGNRCLRALYAFRESLKGLKCPRDLNTQNKDLIRLHHRLNEELTNVARKIAKIRTSLKQHSGNYQQQVSSDTRQLIIPTLILTLRDLFLLGTPGYKAPQRPALPPLPPLGKFTYVTIQYVTSTTKRLSFLIRDLMEHCETEAPTVQLGWNEFSQVLDEWKFELQEKIGAVNEEMSRQEKIARDKAIREKNRQLKEIEGTKAAEQWNKMAASTQRMRHQPRPMVEKQRLADQYISPPQESISPLQSHPSSSSRPYSSYIETARRDPSTSQQTRVQAPPPRPLQVRPPWPPSRRRVVGLPRSSQDLLPLPSLIQPFARKAPALQLPVRQPQPHSSRRTVSPQEQDAMVINSPLEPEPFAIPDHIATPSRQARPHVELEAEEVVEGEAEEEEQEFEDGANREKADDKEAQEEESEDDETFAKVWNISDKGFLLDELYGAETRGQGITPDDLEDWSELFECPVQEIRRQIFSLQREGLWKGSL